MPFISQRDREFLTQKFAEELVEAVQILLFTGRPAPPLFLPGQQQAPVQNLSRETKELMEELTQLSPLLSLEVKELTEEKDLARQYGIDRSPALLLGNGATDGRVRFFGIPSGFEFATLIEDLVDLSRGTTELSDDTLEALAGLSGPVHLQVFVTPT